MKDLRNAYAEQGRQKKDQGQYTIKNLWNGESAWSQKSEFSLNEIYNELCNISKCSL